MTKNVFLVCSVILFVLVGLDKQFSKIVFAQAPKQNTVTGWFTVIWGDSASKGGENIAPIYYLTTESGQTIQLLFSEGIFSTDDLMSMNGQLITVEGYPVDEPNFYITTLIFHVQVVQIISINFNEVKQSVGAGLHVSKPWITLLCRLPDIEGEQKTPSYFEGIMSNNYPGLDHYWQELSYGNINLSGSVTVSHWYDLPYPKSHYISDDQTIVYYYDLLDDCVSAVDNEVYFPDYYGINLIFNDNLEDLAVARGASEVHRGFDGVEKSYGVTWLYSGAGQSQCVMAHEMGHGFGLSHSGSDYDVMNVTGSCIAADSIYGALGKHTIVYHKDRLGWIPDSKKYIVGFGKPITLTMSRRALPTLDDLLMIEIPIEPSGERFYTLELLKAAGYDQVGSSSEGILIHKVDEQQDIPAQFVEFFPVGAMIFTDTVEPVIICQDPLNEIETQIHITSDLNTFCSTDPDLTASNIQMQPIMKGNEWYDIKITLLNIGPPAQNVTVTVPFLPQTLYITGSVNTTQGTIAFEDSALYYDVGVLPFNEPVVFSFIIELRSGIVPAGTYTSPITITWDGGDFSLNYEYNIPGYTYLPLIMR